VDFQAAIEAVARRVEPHRGRGKVADYIPALACIPPERFGLAVLSCDGQAASVGNAEMPFSIQSISKVFTLCLLMKHVPEEQIWKRVWREPSGTPFNSIIQLETNVGVPRNPFVNAGALVVTDMLISHFGRSGAIEAILQFVQGLCGAQGVVMDEEVARSERATAHRNAGLAHVIASFGNLKNSVDDVIDVYCHQCAIAMSVKWLACAGVFLANNGFDTRREREIVPNDTVRRLNALMLTCGHYDAAGDFAYRVGLPGKSGVGGGILAIVPGKASVAVWSPGLNEFGNSLVGTMALEAFVEETNLEIL
jgi:glutaminase